MLLELPDMGFASARLKRKIKGREGGGAVKQAHLRYLSHLYVVDFCLAQTGAQFAAGDIKNRLMV
jgi:hypothetical protein